MLLRFQDTVAADTEAVFRWWSDVGEGDVGVMPPLRDRRVLRREGGVVEVEDRWRIAGLPFRSRATFTPHPPNRWTVRTTFRLGTVEDRVTIKPDGVGTRMEVEIELDLRPPWNAGARLLRPLIRRLFRHDMEAVNTALEADLARRAP